MCVYTYIPIYFSLLPSHIRARMVNKLLHAHLGTRHGRCQLAVSHLRRRRFIGPCRPPQACRRQQNSSGSRSSLTNFWHCETGNKSSSRGWGICHHVPWMSNMHLGVARVLGETRTGKHCCSRGKIGKPPTPAAREYFPTFLGETNSYIAWGSV